MFLHMSFFNETTIFLLLLIDSTVTLDTVSLEEVYVIFSKLPHWPGGWRNEDGLVEFHLCASVTSDVPHLLTCF